MDNGTWQREKRNKDVKRAKQITDNIVFHSVECSLQNAKARIFSRNSRDKQIYIDKNTFDELLPKFEPISESERYKIIRYDNN